MNWIKTTCTNWANHLSKYSLASFWFIELNLLKISSLSVIFYVYFLSSVNSKFDESTWRFSANFMPVTIVITVFYSSPANYTIGFFIDLGSFFSLPASSLNAFVKKLWVKRVSLNSQQAFTCYLQSIFSLKWLENDSIWPKTDLNCYFAWLTRASLF